MENKHLDNKTKKTDKVRRKLLIGAAATPMIMTLHSSKALAQIDILNEGILSPSKAKRDGNELGYSGLLEGSGTGTIQTELSLYAFLANQDIRPSINAYSSMMDKHDAAILAIVVSAITNSESKAAVLSTLSAHPDYASLTGAVAKNCSYTLGAGGLLLPDGIYAPWTEINAKYVELPDTNPSINSIEEKETFGFSIEEELPG